MQFGGIPQPSIKGSAAHISSIFLQILPAALGQVVSIQGVLAQLLSNDNIPIVICSYNCSFPRISVASAISFEVHSAAHRKDVEILPILPSVHDNTVAHLR